MSKASNLTIALKNGFNVPPFYVVEISELFGISPAIDEVLDKCKVENAKDISSEIERMIKTAIFPADAILIEDGKKYAVRSSGADEDSEAFSFAGQYASFLNVTGFAEVKKCVIDCYISQYSEQNILYRLSCGLPLSNLSMSVIIQEMIDPHISGVAFSVNVLTGADTQIVYDVSAKNENSTDGKSMVSNYVYDWYIEKEIESNESSVVLTPNQKDGITSAVLRLQCLFGHPVDVEFAFEQEVVYILQVRPVTKIVFGTLKEQFTNANFRDGGVSARTCNALLWSLYNFSYHDTLKKFFIATRAFKPKEITRQIRIFCGKPYFNVTACKKASAKLPGFVERDYDADLGIYSDYEGKGMTTRITPRFLLNLPFVLQATFRTLRANERGLENNKKILLKEYQRFASIKLASLDIKQKEAVYKELILSYYAMNEGTYFWQVFVNIVRLSLYRRQVQKQLSHQEYFDLLSDIKDISHVRVYDKAEEIAGEILADKDSCKFWRENSAELIAGQYKKNKERFCLRRIDDLNGAYGYHSYRELDLTFPDFYEDPYYAASLIKDALDAPAKNNSDRYYRQHLNLMQKLSKSKCRKVIRSAEKMRKFLWWREEYKDLSTRGYSLIRKFTLDLASAYVYQGIIEKAEDIFHLAYTDIFDFIDGRVDHNHIKKTIEKNRLYYSSFTSYNSPNEIGGELSAASGRTAKSEGFSGVGCGGGKALGTVRVIAALSELEDVKEGEIIVARHFDAGFTYKFKLISGIITETGGVLCHSSIIAREFGLPSIVTAGGITQKLKTGDHIEMDACSGAIKLLKKR